MKVYITSFDILRENYFQPGIIYFKKGIFDEDFKSEFLSNKQFRYKRWVNKSILLTEFIEEISEEIGASLVFFLFYCIDCKYALARFFNL